MMLSDRVTGQVSSKRILVVERDLQMASTIRMALEAGGHQVQLAENGEAALRLFETAKPELVIADFALGEMDGLELAQALREQAPTQPIVLITENAEKVAGQVSNVTALIGKPFSLTALYQALQVVFPTG